MTIIIFFTFLENITFNTQLNITIYIKLNKKKM